MENELSKQRILQLRSMPYNEYLKTREWAEKREQALERDGHRCRLCNTYDNLQVHHRTYQRRGNEDLDDLTTLCKSCHEHFHQKVDQDEIMLQTYSAPVPDLETRRKESVLKWEYYLVGLLLQRPDLYACVCGILSESDLSGDDTRSLYVLFNTSIKDNKTIQELIPQHLENTASKAIDRAKLDELESFTGWSHEHMIKQAVVQTAIRIKEHSLLQLNAKLKTHIRQAYEAGDKETERKYFLQSMDIVRQLQTLNTLKRQQH